MIKDRDDKGRFVKGLKPWDFKKHWEPGGNNIKTRFKKGHVPSSTKPVGSIRYQKDGYMYIKENDRNKWVLYQRYLWEKHYHKKLPKNMVVIFLDGNKRNFAINNLAAVTRSELMYINHQHLHFNDTELSRSGILIAKVLIKIRKEKLNNEKR